MYMCSKLKTMALIQTKREASSMLILVLIAVAHFQIIESVCTIDCVGSGGADYGSVCEFLVEEELPIGAVAIQLKFSVNDCDEFQLVGADVNTYFSTNGDSITVKKVFDYEEDTKNLPGPIFFQVSCEGGEECNGRTLVIQYININDNQIKISDNGSTAEVWELITYPAGDPLDVVPRIYATDADVESYILYTIKDEQSPFRLVDGQGNEACFDTYDSYGSIVTESPILEVSEDHVFNYRNQSSHKITVLIQSFLGGSPCSGQAVETVEYPLVVNVKAVDVPRCECVCQCCSAAPDIQSGYQEQETKP